MAMEVDGPSSQATAVDVSVAPSAAAIEEERLRQERRKKASAELAEFNGRLQREIKERQDRNRQSRAALAGGQQDIAPEDLRPSAGLADGGPLAAMLLAAAGGSSGAAGARGSASQDASCGSAAGLDGGILGMLAADPAMLQAALADPAAAAMLQEVMGGGMGPVAPVSVLASVAATPAALAVRVRESCGERDTFRQVSVPFEDGRMSFAQVEARICAKFRSTRDADGVELGLRRLVALVRLADRLEVADDEDVGLLKDADELEVTFAQLDQ